MTQTLELTRPKVAQTKGSMKKADLSKMISPAAERAKLRKAAERVNTNQPADHIKYKSDKASSDLRKSATNAYKPRVRAPNEALPITSTNWKGSTYKTGDGDVVAFQRPGSDHSHIKSRGLST